MNSMSKSIIPKKIPKMDIHLPLIELSLNILTKETMPRTIEQIAATKTLNKIIKKISEANSP